MLSFHDAGAACKNGQGSGKGNSQEAAPGGVPHTGPDHPILWANSANVPESYYLKFFIFQVVDEK